MHKYSFIFETLKIIKENFILLLCSWIFLTSISLVYIVKLPKVYKSEGLLKLGKIYQSKYTHSNFIIFPHSFMPKLMLDERRKDVSLKLQIRKDPDDGFIHFSAYSKNSKDAINYLDYLFEKITKNHELEFKVKYKSAQQRLLLLKNEKLQLVDLSKKNNCSVSSPDVLNDCKQILRKIKKLGSQMYDIESNLHPTKSYATSIVQSPDLLEFAVGVSRVKAFIVSTLLSLLISLFICIMRASAKSFLDDWMSLFTKNLR